MTLRLINAEIELLVGADNDRDDGINLLRFNPKFEVVVLDKSEKDKLKTEIADAHAIIVRSGVKVTQELLKSQST